MINNIMNSIYFLIKTNKNKYLLKKVINICGNDKKIETILVFGKNLLYWSTLLEHVLFTEELLNEKKDYSVNNLKEAFRLCVINKNPEIMLLLVNKIKTEGYLKNILIEYQSVYSENCFRAEIADILLKEIFLCFSDEEKLQLLLNIVEKRNISFFNRVCNNENWLRFIKNNNNQLLNVLSDKKNIAFSCALQRVKPISKFLSNRAEAHNADLPTVKIKNKKIMTNKVDNDLMVVV